jgi:hypothetical protein
MDREERVRRMCTGRHIFVLYLYTGDYNSKESIQQGKYPNHLGRNSYQDNYLLSILALLDRQAIRDHMPYWPGLLSFNSHPQSQLYQVEIAPEII